jgi:hypothetical protein
VFLSWNLCSAVPGILQELYTRYQEVCVMLDPLDGRKNKDSWNRYENSWKSVVARVVLNNVFLSKARHVTLNSSPSYSNPIITVVIIIL